MKLEKFEEWFAIRANHRDDDHWPGRLTPNVDEGISLATARFVSDAESHGDKTFHSTTMTGWLDYQRPTTLIRPFIHTVDGFTLGIDTPAQRASYRFSIGAVLKNVFLEDINEPIFKALVVEHPAFHAWINPRLVNHNWSQRDGLDLPLLSVEVATPRQREFRLHDGTEAVVTSAVRVHQDEKFADYTALGLRFCKPIHYDAVTKIIWRISVLFEFLIGARTASPVYQLLTTRTRTWNDEPREVKAELWIIPVRKRIRKNRSLQAANCLTIESRLATPLHSLLDVLMGGSDELIYLANIIQDVEDGDLSITQGYGEIIGCLEAYDTKQFGSGADTKFPDDLRCLKELVRTHGSNENNALSERMRRGIHNNFSLVQRLERLHEFWHADGFRGNPNLRRIRDLRNMLPHGRGLHVSSSIANETAIYLKYLTALGRYHVLRTLGCTSAEIATAFLSQPHRYGFFAPEWSFSKR